MIACLLCRPERLAAGAAAAAACLLGSPEGRGPLPPLLARLLRGAETRLLLPLRRRLRRLLRRSEPRLPLLLHWRAAAAAAGAAI